jgi:hypothetical protein
VIRQYVRYLPPKNSFGNIAEFEVRGPAAGTVIEQQVRRMLADPRARAITDNFAVYWLQLHKLPSARPSTEFFPEFNANIRQAMFDETALFFDSLRRDDGCLLSLLQADYTFVNEELAKYYGLPDVTGKEMRRIALPPELRAASSPSHRTRRGPVRHYAASGYWKSCWVRLRLRLRQMSARFKKVRTIQNPRSRPFAKS